MSRLALVISVVLVSFNSAHAFELKPVVGINLGSSKVSPEAASTTYGGRNGLLLGALMEVGLIPGLFALEFGALRVPYGSSAVTTSGASITTVEASWSVIQLPLVLRMTALPIVSFGAGPYMGFALGQVSTTISGTGLTTTSSDSDLTSAAKTDFGALLSCAAKFPLLPLVDFLFDARLLVGFKNLTDAAGSSVKINHIQMMAGAAIGF